MASINNQFCFILIKSTDNDIGDTGAASLSDALKTNTTLTQLNLYCEHKRNSTDNENTSTIHSSSINTKSTDNGIGETGATSMSDALKSNTALTQLWFEGEHKRNNTQMTSINNPLFLIFT